MTRFPILVLIVYHCDIVTLIANEGAHKLSLHKKGGEIMSIVSVAVSRDGIARPFVFRCEPASQFPL